MDDEQLAAARARFMQGLQALKGGDAATAEGHLRASLALLPGRPSTLTNLAVALLRQARPAEALPLLDAVLAQAPEDVDALGHRGVALNALQRPAEAGPVFERVLALAPGRPEAWFHHGQTLQMLGRHDDALASYERCLALQPDHARAHSQRGSALQEAGRHDEAAAAYERALALGDDAELNTWYLASLGRGTAPDAAPHAWVQGLFDDYAADFDRHLVDTLGYRVPEALVRLLVGSGRLPFDSALDLGCGTGLCGPRLRPMVQRLTGVDLSAAMLDAARARGVYDALECAELLQHLQGTDARHALVVAADVFIYVGELDPVFAAVQRVLRPGGLFAFSVEAAPPGTERVLQASLRYAHGEGYLRRLAAARGFEVLQAEALTLREDQGRDVAGRLLLLERR